MPRVAQRLVGTRFDLLIVGGGIHGLFAALEAALRGWTVALVERDDFGSGLSFNHQRTIHGGLRTLESGRLRRTQQQIAERRAWAVMAPHLVRPLPFLLPLRGGLSRSRLALGAAFRMYDWLGRSRNEGLPRPLHLPPGRLIDPREVRNLFPAIAGNLTGGALWHDYQLRHPDRLNWLVALAAERAGAALVNHVEAIAPLLDGTRVVGVRVRDTVAHSEHDVVAASTLVCAGGGVAALHEAFGLKGAPLLLRATNILVNRPGLDVALASRGASGRMLTATPWAGKWLVGTFQSPRPLPASDLGPARDDVDAMIDDANVAFSSLHVRRRDVLLVQSGLTPAVMRGGRAELMPEHLVLDHSRHGRSGVFTLVGVKFTTARLAAVEALHRMRLAGRSTQSSIAVSLPPALLPGAGAEGALAAVQAVCVECNVRLDDDVVAHLVDWYGTEAPDVVRGGAAAGRLDRLAADRPVIAGEIVHAIDRGRAMTLDDAVLRRTSLGTAGHPGSAALEAAADIMAARFDWTREQRALQIARVERRYRI